MGYCEPKDLEPIPHEKLKPYVDPDDKTKGKIKQARLQEFIDSTSAVMDSYLSASYVIPIPITAVRSLTILKQICFQLTIQSLYSYNNEADLPKTVSRDADAAQELFDSYTGVKTEDGRPKFLLPDAPRNADVLAVYSPRVATDYTSYL